MNVGFNDLVREDPSRPAGVVLASQMNTVEMDASVWASFNGNLVIVSFIGTEMNAEAAASLVKARSSRLYLRHDDTTIASAATYNADDYIWLRQAVHSHHLSVTIYHKSLIPGDWFDSESFDPLDYYIPVPLSDGVASDFVVTRFYETILRIVEVPVQPHWVDYLWERGQQDDICGYVADNRDQSRENEHPSSHTVNFEFVFVRKRRDLLTKYISEGLKAGKIKMKREEKGTSNHE